MENSSDISEELKEVIHVLATTAPSLIPFIGPFVSEILAKYWLAPSAKRQAEWLKDLASKVEKLEKDKDYWEAKFEDESFQTLLILAIEAAGRTHQQENLEALRNAVINGAITTSPDEIQQKIFIQFIDRFTNWHIKLLELFNDPEIEGINLNLEEPRSLRGVTASLLSDLVEKKYPEMSNGFYSYMRIIKDLYDNDLIANIYPEKNKTPERTNHPRLTPLGRSFLKMIQSPDENN